MSLERVNILMVEDNEGDIILTKRALAKAKLHLVLQVVRDGDEAMRYLLRKGEFTEASRPDIILLDLNLPKKDGREVLAEIKSDDHLRRIPVVILTTSKAEEDVMKTYSLHANCYITKPVDLNEFNKIIQTLEDFWFTVVKLPKE